jgi:hypothetical protein
MFICRSNSSEKSISVIIIIVLPDLITQHGLNRAGYATPQAPGSICALLAVGVSTNVMMDLWASNL